MSKSFNKWWGVPIGFGSGLVLGVVGAVGATGVVAAMKKTRHATLVTGVASLAGTVAAWTGLLALANWTTKKAIKEAVAEAQALPAQSGSTKTATPMTADVPGAGLDTSSPVSADVMANPLSGAFPYAGLLTPAIDKWRGKSDSVLLGRGVRILY